MTPTHTHTHTHAQRTGKLFNEKFPDSDDVQYVQPPSPSSPFFFYLSMDVRNSTVANSPRIQEIERERERERERASKKMEASQLAWQIVHIQRRCHTQK